VRAVQAGPLTGLIAQVLLLAAFAWTVGLSGGGRVFGVTCGLITNVALARGLSRYRSDRLGSADWVTPARAKLAAGVAALTADSFDQAAPVTGRMATRSAGAVDLELFQKGLRRVIGACDQHRRVVEAERRQTMTHPECLGDRHVGDDTAVVELAPVDGHSPEDAGDRGAGLQRRDHPSPHDHVGCAAATSRVTAANGRASASAWCPPAAGR
jgi:hypothetical protein